jgi:hypothetical protein
MSSEEERPCEITTEAEVRFALSVSATVRAGAMAVALSPSVKMRFPAGTPAMAGGLVAAVSPKMRMLSKAMS